MLDVGPSGARPNTALTAAKPADASLFIQVRERLSPAVIPLVSEPPLEEGIHRFPVSPAVQKPFPLLLNFHVRMSEGGTPRFDLAVEGGEVDACDLERERVHNSLRDRCGEKRDARGGRLREGPPAVCLLAHGAGHFALLEPLKPLTVGHQLLQAFRR